MEETLSPHLALVPDVFDEVIKGIDYSDNHGWIPWAWGLWVSAHAWAGVRYPRLECGL